MWWSFGDGGSFGEVGEGWGFDGVGCLKASAFLRLLGGVGRIGSRKAQKTCAGFDFEISVENNIFRYLFFVLSSSRASSLAMYSSSNLFDSRRASIC